MKTVPVLGTVQRDWNYTGWKEAEDHNTETGQLHGPLYLELMAHNLGVAAVPHI